MPATRVRQRSILLDRLPEWATHLDFDHTIVLYPYPTTGCGSLGAIACVLRPATHGDEGPTSPEHRVLHPPINGDVELQSAAR